MIMVWEHKQKCNTLNIDASHGLHVWTEVSVDQCRAMDHTIDAIHGFDHCPLVSDVGSYYLHRFRCLMFCATESNGVTDRHWRHNSRKLFWYDFRSMHLISLTLSSFSWSSLTMCCPRQPLAPVTNTTCDFADVSDIWSSDLLTKQ